MKTQSKMIKGARFILRYTDHFLDRTAQRLEESDLPLLDRTIEKAIKKTPIDPIAHNQPVVKWRHPAFGITVVFQRVGLNAADMITTWKKEEDAE